MKLKDIEKRPDFRRHKKEKQEEIKSRFPKETEEISKLEDDIRSGNAEK